MTKSEAGDDLPETNFNDENTNCEREKWSHKIEYLLSMGLVLLLLSAIITFYYNIITTWVLYYIVNSFVNLIPWSTCDNDWNTQFCVSKNTHINTSEGVSNQHMFPIYAINNTSGNDTERNVSLITNTYVTTAEDFWQNSVSSLKSVVYVTATMPYIILAVLFVRGVTLPGGVDSIVCYLKPNFSRRFPIKS
ncbi:hypothetical protein KUTeg_018737 [Tegillarca granosa]|uniref:Uncharacterized protein n=1 Tax=Tegillarca granosa TaxID=220873 RepID=A0ABQ9EJY0_TEGGR|nr:hypothetical protein KUTeg_018737 [Tegillarca granosa]